MAVKWQTRSERRPGGGESDPGSSLRCRKRIYQCSHQIKPSHEAEEQGVIGKESTPFLLARVAELTGGDSLKSNIQLVFNNAILASEIAKEYQQSRGLIV